MLTGTRSVRNHFTGDGYHGFSSPDGLPQSLPSDAVCIYGTLPAGTQVPVAQRAT